MMMVIFEFKVRPGKDEAYFALSRAMGDEVARIDGFLGIERFQSVSDPDKYVSISLWRDDEAIATWRAQSDHRRAQAKGKSEIFEEFRLRVVEVAREINFRDGAREALDHRAA